MKRLIYLLLCSVVALAGCRAVRVVGPPVSGFVIQDLVVGTGAIAQRGDKLWVTYHGRFSDGTPFDSTATGSMFYFVLGTGEVIRGWDLGMPGARVGGTRRLVIPPRLAYGALGVPPLIPPNATLIFDIELLQVQAPLQ